MNKGDLSESDIKTQFITPPILNAGWDKFTQFGREVYFTAGRILIQAQPAKTLKNLMRRGIYMFSVALPIKQRDEGFEDIDSNWEYANHNRHIRNVFVHHG